MTASIIIALDSGENFTRNFLCFLSKYETIRDYEIILTSDGNNEIDYNKIIYEFFGNNCIYINNDKKQGYGIANNPCFTICFYGYINFYECGCYFREKMFRSLN